MVTTLPSVKPSISSSLGSSVSDTASSLETESSKPSLPLHQSNAVDCHISLLALAAPPCGVLGEQGSSWVIQGNEVYSVGLRSIHDATGIVLDKRWKMGIQLAEEQRLIATAVSRDNTTLALVQSTAIDTNTILIICSVIADSCANSHHRDVDLDVPVSTLSFGRGNTLYAGTSRGEILILTENTPPTRLDYCLHGHQVISMSYSDHIPQGLLLIATTERVCIIRLDNKAGSEEPVWVGSRGHHGRFGAALLDDGRICCARPGGRLWMADISLLDDSCNYATLSVQSTLKFSTNGESISLGMLWIVGDRHILSIGGNRNNVYLLDVETVEVAHDFGPLTNNRSSAPFIVTVSSMGDCQDALLHIGYYPNITCITALVKANIIGKSPDIIPLSLSFPALPSKPRSLPTRSSPCSVSAASDSSRSKPRSEVFNGGGIEVLNLSNFPRAIDALKDRPILHVGTRSLRHPILSSTTGSRDYEGKGAGPMTTRVKKRLLGAISTFRGTSVLTAVNTSDVGRVYRRARLLSISSTFCTQSPVVEEIVTPSWIIDALTREKGDLAKVDVIRDELDEVFTHLGWAQARRILLGIQKDDGSSSTSRLRCEAFRYHWMGAPVQQMGDRYLQLLPHAVIHPRRDLDLLLRDTTPRQFLDKYPAGLFVEGTGVAHALDTLRGVMPVGCPSGLLHYTVTQCHGSVGCQCLAQRVLDCVADTERHLLTLSISSLGPLLPGFLLHTIAVGRADLLVNVLLAMEESSIVIEQDILDWLWERAWQHG